MKNKTLKTVAMVAGITLSCAASAAMYTGYYAEAHSDTSYGWGFHFTSSRQAQRIAMRNCVARTPSWDTCYVDSAQWGHWNINR